jgi:hypothetical protein
MYREFRKKTSEEHLSLVVKVYDLWADNSSARETDLFLKCIRNLYFLFCIFDAVEKIFQ